MSISTTYESYQKAAEDKCRATKKLAEQEYILARKNEMTKNRGEWSPAEDKYLRAIQNAHEEYRRTMLEFPHHQEDSNKTTDANTPTK
jgi:CTP-dependent riboflavin kinase